MRIDNPVETLAQSLYTALSNKEILPDLSYEWQSPQERRDGKPKSFHYRRPEVRDVLIIQFGQMWGSTALGFGGMGGAAMTSAYTTIIHTNETAAVFFGGMYAYTVAITEPFESDVAKHQMASVSDSKKYHPQG